MYNNARAEEFIDKWANAYAWREELGQGKLSVKTLLTQLHSLEKAEPTRGRPSWGEVERALRAYKEKDNEEVYQTSVAYLP